MGVEGVHLQELVHLRDQVPSNLIIVKIDFIELLGEFFFVFFSFILFDFIFIGDGVTEGNFEFGTIFEEQTKKLSGGDFIGRSLSVLEDFHDHLRSMLNYA